MVLKKLLLKNFKALRNVTFEFGENKTGVRGTNATGKSTLVDAFYWLLYDKDRKGRTDYDIKTRENADVVHGLDHAVTGIFDGGETGGRTIKLTRTFHEKWTRKRGDANDTFTGHETVYSVDDVEVKKSDYDSRVEELFGHYDDFRMLSDPLFFADTLDWKKRRAKVMQIAGNISNETVGKADPELYKRIQNLLNDTDDIEGMIVLSKGKQRKVNAELDELRLRIDETTATLANYKDSPTTEPAHLVEKARELEEKIVKKSDEIALVRAGADGSIEIKNEIGNLSVALQDLQAKRQNRDRVATEEFEAKQRLYNRGIAELREHLGNIDQNIVQLDKELNDLREEYKEIQQDEFRESPNCFNCGQRLPEDVFENEKRNWNASRAKMLKENKERGTSVSEKKRVLQENKDLALGQLEAQKIALQNLSAHGPSPKSKQELELEVRIEALRSSLSNASVSTNTDALQSSLNALRAHLKVTDDKLSQYRVAQQMRDRLEAHKKRQLEMSGVFQSLAQEIVDLEAFFLKKLDMIEENVFKTFGVRFKMFNRLINGGVDPCCDVLVECEEGLIPFQSANDAARIVYGLTIIENLSTRLGKWVPIFIDNAESVISTFSDFKGQIIRLIVDSEYNTLTMMEE